MSWECNRCDWVNDDSLKKCSTCGAQKGEFECPPSPATFVENPTDEAFRKAFCGARQRYAETLGIVAGMGERGQQEIDKYYEEMVAAHGLMSLADRWANKLPEKEQSHDDGNGGIASGLGDHFSRQKKHNGDHFSGRQGQEEGCKIQ